MTLTADQRRALVLLAGDERGATEALMLTHGFKREMLARLVLAGLATVVTETMRAGAATIKVERYRITDDGRDALAAGG
jgi:hypothetical protein